MALQNSGAIAISEIKAELGSNSSSLTTLSVAAGKSAPHGMQEFYGFSSFQTFQGSTASDLLNVCSQSTNTQYFHDGSSSIPVVNDVVFTNNTGTTHLAQGIYKTSNSFIMVIGSNGVVTNMTACP
tara:strand:- start:113 stop:490 length:378 start_codon:yes stop_codon:yes gene_type:complete